VRADRVDALLREDEALHRPAPHEVALHDLRHVLHLHASVPHRLRIDDDRRAVFALVEAPRGVGADRLLEPAPANLLLEAVPEALAPVGVAGPARVLGGTAVDADEDVVAITSPACARL
jgi:hypothetical protein